MPTTRRRAEQEFEATPQQQGTQTITLSSLTGGRNGYSNPELLSPQFWADPTFNVYSGLHGAVRRARWAPLLNSTTSGYSITSVRMASMFGVYFPLQNPWLFFDTSGQIWFFDMAAHTATKVSLQATSLFLLSAWNLTGPFIRLGIGGAGMVFQTNGSARSKIFNNAGVPTLELDGIDAPDAAPRISLSTGSTVTLLAAPNGASRTSNVVTFTANAGLPGNFVVGNYFTVAGVTDTGFNSATGTAFQMLTVSSPSFTANQIGPDATSGSGTATVGITKTVGRSYQYAWENANTGHLGPPSPASQYVAYSTQYGTINCIQPGTVTYNSANAIVTGVNTFFTSAWVGRALWVNGFGTLGDVASVQSSTQLTLALNSPHTAGGDLFQIYDRQVTHLRLYATGDGGTVYLRIARNAFLPNLGGVSQAGLTFVDTAPSEPPNTPFTNEIAQIQNVPPPIGSFQDQYQGRRINYGVAGAPQSFFYSNIEATVVGQPPESYAPLNQVTLPIGDGQLNGTANLPTGFILWSNRQEMFKLTGQLTDNTVANPQQLGAAIQRLPYRIGSASAYATAVTSLGAFWLSSDREVWLFTDHYAPKNIGKPIQDILNRINGTRLAFAKMKNYKSGDRNWLVLAIALDTSAFNNQLCALDLDLLSSNGQPSFFTFDMATNQPSWYLYNTNCEAIEAAFDANSTNHLLAGDIDLITDLDWQPAYYTVSAEQSVPGPQLTLHALGNQDPELIKTGRWMRVTTNQLPKNLASQGWSWSILCYDDDKFVLGVQANPVSLVPGVDSPNQVFALEYSPSVFRFGGLKPVKGRRFQIQCNFPSGPGFYELRGYQVSYDQIVAR